MKIMYVSKSLIYLFLVICVCKNLYSQDKRYYETKLNGKTIVSTNEILGHLSLGGYSIYPQGLQYSKSKSNNAFIKAKLDSIRSKLKSDSVSSGLIFFNIDISDENAYGCMIVKDSGKINGNSIELINREENAFLIDRKSINTSSKTINELFSYPSQFLEKFFHGTLHQLSHDNEMYFFLKVNGNILFDKFFMRSSFIRTSNEKSKNLIILLGGL